jgi:hypothetical protein
VRVREYKHNWFVESSREAKQVHVIFAKHLYVYSWLDRPSFAIQPPPPPPKKNPKYTSNNMDNHEISSIHDSQDSFGSQICDYLFHGGSCLIETLLPVPAYLPTRKWITDFARCAAIYRTRRQWSFCSRQREEGSMAKFVTGRQAATRALSHAPYQPQPSLQNPRTV